MTPGDVMLLPDEPTVTAPDGSDVRVLLRLSGGSMAHFSLAVGRCSAAVRHRSVEELWYVLAGRAVMWRSREGIASQVALAPGTCVSIPRGTSFQFCTVGEVPFAAVAVTMPPWPGSDDEAEPVAGPWQPS
jgi:mannose-6-phosphate isomerase-like protein (cupin superfamily)